KMSVKNQKIAFVILIGGKSARFGSDKGVFEFLGKPLLSYLLETLKKFKRDIFIIAYSQEQVDIYKERIKFGENITFITDNRELIEDQDLRSPMIGLYSAFKKLIELDYEKAFTFSCDSPLIKSEVVDLLLRQAEGYDCYVPRWENGFIEPLFTIYPVKKAYKQAKDSLINKTFKLTNLVNKDWKVN
ncbi:MAG: molybdenum cofactor guanylyltransferase, partial [archaeon]|nr:molybdenum cofactor guanylyltransferase [archaeon]